MDEDDIGIEDTTVRFRAPRDFVERIDERASADLISRSAWIRRELSMKLRQPENAR